MMHFLATMFLLCMGVLAKIVVGEASLSPLNQMAVLASICIMGLLGFFRPRHGLLAIIFLIPILNNVYFLERLNNFPPDLVVFLGFTAGWSLHQIYHGRPVGLAVPIKWTLIGYLTIGVGSGIITILRYSQFYPLVGDRFQSLTVNLLDESNHEAILWAFQSLLTFIAGPAILWAVFNLIERRRHVIQVLLALALGMIIPIVLGIAQSLGWEFLMTERGIRDHRVNATFVDSNALACFFMLAVPAIASLIFLLRQFWSRLAIVLLVICGLYVLICSGSRTGLLDIVIVIITGIFLFLTHLLRAPLRGRIRIGKVVIVMAVFLMAIGLVEVLSARYGRSVLGARMERTIQAAREKGFINMIEASNRWPMWKRAGKIISTFPFTGIGLGAYHTEIPNFMKWTPYDTFVRDSACNYYLQLYAEMGPIGLLFGILILVVILYYTSRLALRHSLHPPELVLGCILCADLFAMILMFVTGAHTLFVVVQMLFWMIIGIVFVEWRNETEKGPAPEPIRPRRLWFPHSLGMRFSAATLIIVFLACQFSNAVTVLSLRERRQLYEWEASHGFYPWEIGKTGDRVRWTRKEAATMIPTWHPLASTVVFVSNPAATAEDPVIVKITIDGKIVAEETFKRPDESHALTLLIPPTDKDQVEMQFSVSKTFVPSHVFENCYDIREIGALVSDVKFSNLPVPDGFGFSSRQTDPAQPEMTYRSIESQAALPVPLTTTGFIEFLASVGPGEDETEPSMLRIYCDKVFSKYVVLNDMKWVKVQLNVGDRPEDLASLLHFEVDFASKGHNLRKPRPVRITNPVAASQTQGAEVNPDVSKMLANVDSRIQDDPTLMSVANRK